MKHFHQIFTPFLWRLYQTTSDTAGDGLLPLGFGAPNDNQMLLFAFSSNSAELAAWQLDTHTHKQWQEKQHVLTEPINYLFFSLWIVWKQPETYLMFFIPDCET